MKIEKLKEFKRALQKEDKEYIQKAKKIVKDNMLKQILDRIEYVALSYPDTVCIFFGVDEIISRKLFSEEERQVLKETIVSQLRDLYGFGVDEIEDSIAVNWL